MPAHLSAPAAGFRRRDARNFALLASVSIMALTLASLEAGAVPVGQGTGAANSASSAAAYAAQNTQQQAQRAAEQAQRAMSRVRNVLQDMQSAQAAARAAALAAQSAVPNGLGVGGLQRAPGAVPGSDLWQGANLPEQVTDGDRVKVNIEQTQQKAILTWDTFNVGGQTDLTFQQQASNWVALNRVLGTDNKPSQILGSINAKGQVYVINQNGIIFGGASQVNVGALIASTAKMDAAGTQRLIDNGIYATTPVFADAAELLGLKPDNPDAGKIRVEAGAQITTHAPADVTQGGGFVLLMGGEVVNAGSITTPLGQAQLAAGDDFVLRPGYDPENYKFSTTRGNEIAPLFDTNSLAGLVRNNGLIFSPQGDITLAGRTIEQDGILVASTSVNTRGTIHLLSSATDRLGSITLGADSVTTIIPELESTETALNLQRDGLIAASEEANILRSQADFGIFNNLSKLADRLDQSRIEIVTGGDVIFKGGATPEVGSLTIAQGGQVAVSAGRRIFTESGSIIDVSGVRDVSLAMSANNILVNIQGSELRDSPVNRDLDYLKNADVWVDIRDLIYVPAGTGGYGTAGDPAYDRYYTPGGLLEVGGYLANTKHTIGEWTALGGTITLAANEVVAQQGSVFNISGGSVSYAGGYIYTSNFVGADGRFYNIDDARGDLQFLGLAGNFYKQHERWNVTEVWTSFFSKGGVTRRWEDGYTIGRDAGTLILSTPTAIFEGDILADVVQGQRQFSARPDDVTDAYKLSQNTAPLAGMLALGQYGALGRVGVYDSDVVISDFENITAGKTAADALGRAANTVWLDAGWLNDQKLGGLDIATGLLNQNGTSGSAVRGSITIESDVQLADGGIVNLVAPVIDIKADITARGGSVTASNQLVRGGFSGTTISTFATDIFKGGAASVVLRSGAMIDTRGLWTNALLDPTDLSGLGFINGGAVTLRSTGDVTLESGSLIDASSGGAILPNGKTQGGAGGDIALIASYAPSNVSASWPGGKLTLDGRVASSGFTRGGKLTLNSNGIVVIGDQTYDLGTSMDAGQVLPVDVVLTHDVVWPANTPLPAGATVTIGQTIPQGVLQNDLVVTQANPLVLTADLVIQPNGITNAAIAAGRYLYTAPNGTQQGITLTLGGTIPKGSRLVFNATFVAGKVTVNNGNLVLGSVTTLAAGDKAPVDVTFAAGQKLQAGSLVSTAIQFQRFNYLHLSSIFLNSGFSSYSIHGDTGLVVGANTAISPTMPLLQFTPASYNVATGGAPYQALDRYLAPVYTEDPLHGTLTQRAGVDLDLSSGRYSLEAGQNIPGWVDIAWNASVTVDPGHSVKISSGGQITVDGSITAPSGTISLLDSFFYRGVGDVVSPTGPGGRSIWIGDDASLNVAASAYIAYDLRGNAYGVVPSGGSILIGRDGGSGYTATSLASAADAFIVIAPGAVLDASGTSGIVDLLSGTALHSSRQSVTVASDGGSIGLRSYNGIYAEGTLLANAGGAGASGGVLNVVLESPYYANSGVLAKLNVGRVLTVSNAVINPLAAGLKAGQIDASLSVGRGVISVAQIEQGGFDSVSLWGRTAIAFDGNVTLNTGRSITLNQGAIYDTVAGGNVTLNAPYVFLDGQAQANLPASTAMPSTLPAYPAGGTFSVNASLLDVRNTVTAKFSDTSLTSATDLRFLRSTDAVSAQPATSLSVPGSLELIAEQVYPASGAIVNVSAGTTLTIASVDGVTPDLPYSVFGTISLAAPTVYQKGIVRAPLGSITLGQQPASQTSAGPFSIVELFAGSITSASADGLVIPYGGTTDGVTYTVNGGAPATPSLVGGGFGNGNTTITGVTLVGTRVLTDKDALIDLSGGGALLGAGFISGRGGSVDTLLTALVNSNPANTYSAAGNKVYAIVPGIVTAPVAGGYFNSWTGNIPTVGQQITIPAGVPGLLAGTYTLLPANYALLPGGYRVEIGAQSTMLLNGAIGLNNGSYILGGTQSVANTAIHSSLANQIIVTPGSSVRSYSQYNEQSYVDFQLAQAATFSTARPFLPEDAKTLTISLGALANGATSTLPALVYEGSTDFTPAQNGNLSGLDGNLVLKTAVIWDQLSIGGPDSTTLRSSARIPASSSNWASVIPVSADVINSIGAPNVYIGAAPLVQSGTQSIVFGNGTTYNNWGIQSIVLESGAVLTGSQVVLVSAGGGSIVLQDGAGINTLGRGSSAPDQSLGFTFSAENANLGTSTLLVVSNGDVGINAQRDTAQISDGSIKFGDGAYLYSDGTVAFSAANTPTFTGAPKIGAAKLALSSISFNFGSDAALANAAAGGILPSGLNLTQALLNSLLNGDPVAGAPAVKSLALSAGNSINFFGGTDLEFGGTANGVGQLVLNSPAIYGVGSGDVTLTADTLVWNGNTRTNVTTINNLTTSSLVSATPGSTLVNGQPVLGSGDGAFTVNARQIVFGYPSGSQPNATLSLDRLMLGFSSVNFNASEKITANSKGTLSVYQSGSDPSAISGGYTAASYAGALGVLNLTTPLLTGDPGAIFKVYGGGDVAVTRLAGASPSTATPSALGAEIDITSLGAVNIDTAVWLPTGRFTATAAGDITLGANSKLDLSGQTIPMFDVNKYSWGGDVVLESTHGNIVQMAGSVIDVSATGNDAGSVTLTATDANAGLVQLGGTLLGGSSGGSNGGSIDIRAQKIGDPANLSADFFALNATLDAAGFTQARSFDLKQGNLEIASGQTVRAHKLSISIDGGRLTVNGTIDASGQTVGSITLAARDDLIINGLLDAHGAVLQTDSDGVAIGASNTAEINLTTTIGTLLLNPNAVFDLRSGTATGGDIARGKLTLNVPRTSETSGDIRLAVAGPGPISIQGAKNVSVYGFWNYWPTDDAGTIVQNNGGTTPVNNAGAVGLDQIDTRNKQFMAAAATNTYLSQRLGLLPGAQLAPGVQIARQVVTADNSTLHLSIPQLTVNPALLANYVGQRITFTASRTINAEYLPWYWDVYGGDAASPLFTVLDSDGKIVAYTGATIGYQAPWADRTLVQGQQYTLVITPEMANNPAVIRRLADLDPSFASGLNVNVQPANGNAAPLSNGNLTVSGDIDLSKYRYGPSVNPAVYGSGAPMSLVIRAAGNLTVNGSISDGYAIRAGAPAVYSGLFGDLNTSPNFTLQTSGALTYLAYSGASSTIYLTADWKIPNTAVYSGATIYNASFSQFWSAGQTIPAGTMLYPYFLNLDPNATLPSLATTFVSPATPSSPATSTAGMPLANGLSSSAIRLVAGADLAAAATNTLRAHSALAGSGNLLLSDYHTTASSGQTVIAASVLRTGAADLGLFAGGNFSQGSLYNISTNGAGDSAPADLDVVVQGTLSSYVVNDINTHHSSWNVTNWINGNSGTTSFWDGFTGFGALGGGNVTIDVGGDAGTFARSTNTTIQNVIANTALVAGAKGGGDVRIKIGGRLNPTKNTETLDGFNGSFTNLRGDITVDAGAIGTIPLLYGTNEINDPRGVDAGTAALLAGTNPIGQVLVGPGDGDVLLRTRGDLALGGVGAPATSSLWRPSTSITLFSAGGNLSPENSADLFDVNQRDKLFGGQTGIVSLPPIFSATAASGSIYYGGGVNSGSAPVVTTYRLVASPQGELELLAQHSIYAAATQRGSILSPQLNFPARFEISGADADSNLYPNPATLHSGDTNPIRIYAVDGDLVNVSLGEVYNYTLVSGGPTYTSYVAAKTAQVQAGRDIVNFGRVGNQGTISATAIAPSLILNTNDTDISSLIAGRDIWYANVQVAGPGSLEVIAGRNLYQGDKGSIVSIGPLAIGDNRSGASILMQAGAGADGPNYAGLFPYLDPANLAVVGTPLVDQPGKVAKTYETELSKWLTERYGRDGAGKPKASGLRFADDGSQVVFDASVPDALAFFKRLAPEQQAIFLRTVYFAELREGGREYNNPDSTRYQSYLRGRQAIAALFPDDIAYGGDITMFGSSSVRTQFGGDIQFLAPGGQIVVGIEGKVPPASAGVLTQFGGGIQMFADRSILLGLSRIMTNYGDDIFAWSVRGDINAGRGAKTTIGYTPPLRRYDNYGNVSLVPSVPQAGAGISARSAIPGKDDGDIDLHAPEGTIDVGEAGIAGRNINLSALAIINSANITAQGNVTGVPTIQAPPVAALTTASNLGAATQQALPVQSGGSAQASVMIVEIIGYGGGGGEEQPDDNQRRGPGRQSSNTNYEPTGMVRVLGDGAVTAEGMTQLTEEERSTLASQNDAPSSP